MMVNTKNIYTVSQVAELLNVHRSNIKNYCNNGSVGFKIKHDGLSDSGWILTDKDIEYIQSRMGKRGDKLT